MTIEDIEKAHSREKQIRRLRREIKEKRSNNLPSHVKAVVVNGETHYTSGGGSGTPGDPTKKLAFELEALEERLGREVDSQELFWNEVGVIPSEEIRDIIRLRVYDLKKWRKVSEIMYGLQASQNLAYMTLYRYFANL